MIKIIEELREQHPFFIETNKEELFYKLIGLNCLLTGMAMIPIGIMAIIFSPVIITVSFIDLILNFIFKDSYFAKNVLKKRFKNSIKKTLIKYQKELDKFGSYKLENNYGNDYKHNNNLKLEEFIYNFLNDYRRRFYTSQDNHIVCDRNRRRSLGDIYLICKHYYPGVTLEKVLEILTDLIEVGDISGSTCNEIKKFVYHTDSNHYAVNGKLEYGNNLRHSDIIKYFSK